MVEPYPAIRQARSPRPGEIRNSRQPARLQTANDPSLAATIWQAEVNEMPLKL
jgi:hypothetical protein